MDTPQNKSIKVLYINHYGVVGGAQRSILELISGFPENSVSPHFISPWGSVLQLFKKFNIPYTIVPGGISKFDHTRLGYYRGPRWFILGREIAYFIPTLFILLKLRKKAKEMDIIHINEITCLMPLILVRKLYKKPIVLHARAVFKNDPGLWRTRTIASIFKKYPDRIIAIDENVASTLPETGKLTVIHNSFRYDSKLSDDVKGFAKKLGKIQKRKINIGYIGAIHVNKGIMDLLEAIKMCRDNGLDVNLIIAGNAKNANRGLWEKWMMKLGLSQDRNLEVWNFIRNNKLHHFVYPIGFSTNTKDFFEYIDVLCFPTYYNSLGRPVFEAAFFKKPSIVAIEETFPDSFIEGETGLKVKSGDPVSIYNAICSYYDDPSLVEVMGNAAYELALKNFDYKTNAQRVLSIYQSLLSNK